jgi:D-glycero-D-manno-heptose 1,7-bisphosphate phosphatase
VTLRRAAFLDRDGTIIEDVEYISRPEDVALRPGAAEAIQLLNDNDIAAVVITNQSGIARGQFTLADYEAVRARVTDVLAEHDAQIDATYYCPHHPDFGGACQCRKPGTLLFDLAIADLGIDPRLSMFAGDRLRDVMPARKYGGTAYLISAPSTPSGELDDATNGGIEIVTSLREAVQSFLTSVSRGERSR